MVPPASGGSQGAASVTNTIDPAMNIHRTGQGTHGSGSPPVGGSNIPPAPSVELDGYADLDRTLQDRDKVVRQDQVSPTRLRNSLTHFDRRVPLDLDPGARRCALRELARVVPAS